MTAIAHNMLNPRKLAEMTGYQINTVHAWRKRRTTTGMPEPDLIVGRTPLWRPTTIIPWLRATNRVIDQAPHA